MGDGGIAVSHARSVLYLYLGGGAVTMRLTHLSPPQRHPAFLHPSPFRLPHTRPCLLYNASLRRPTDDSHFPFNFIYLYRLPSVHASPSPPFKCHHTRGGGGAGMRRPPCPGRTPFIYLWEDNQELEDMKWLGATGSMAEQRLEAFLL